MNINLIPTTAMTTVTTGRSGMPTAGRTSATTSIQGRALACAADAAVVRDRANGKDVVKGHVGANPAYFPGTTAWRPPTS